ncbi:MAG: hypothetical protein H7A24_04585 [Leptospiraceae bacterium]|nr:hypothetical protein [Leptospiraceae bacterium]MCP5511133.1 hypothetical protein [Leptospiraceae bacterium]
MKLFQDVKISRQSSIWILILFLLAIFGISSRIWLSEDSYISFRYIDQLFAGNGLVFNKNDRVEGFTHPYWLFLVLIVHSLGIHFHQGSILLGFLLILSGLGIFTYLKLKKGYLLWIFPAILVSHEGFRDFSTSGLEFPLTFFLLSLLTWLNFEKKLDSPFLLGTIISCLYHTRPEMGLLIPFFFFWKILEERKSPNFQWIFRFGLAVLIFAVGYHIFRYAYYHDIFTNTFYAKSGSKSRYYDGFKYLFHFVYYSKFTVLTLIGFVGYTVYSYFHDSRVPELKTLPWRELFLSAFVAHYIIRVGGDFMGFRLLLPYFVIALFAFDQIVNQFFKDRLTPKWQFKLNLVLILIASFLILEKSNYPLVKFGVVNERKAYTKGVYSGVKEIVSGIKHEWFLKGLEYKDLQKCLGEDEFIITNSVTEAKCLEKGVGLGYFGVASGPDVILIDELGLTDKDIAKSGKKSVHDRVGHERSISIEQVIQKKAIFCSLDDERYDRIMNTKYGVILRLNRNFLASLGPEDYETRIKFLKKLYSELKSGSSPEDKKLLARLQMLESQSGESIENLPIQYEFDPQRYNKEFCWQ